MKILIVGAMDSEIDYIKSILENIKEEEHCSFKFYLGNIKDKEIILVKSGIGRVMAGMLIGIAYNNYQFDCIINIGVAGGVKGTNLGDIIVGVNYVYGDVDLRSGGFGYDFGQMAGCPRVYKSNVDLSNLAGNDYVYGDMCTCDSFTTSEVFVNNLNENYFSDLNIKCFDMESAAFAHACNYYNIPFLAIRSISDVIGSSFQSEDYQNNEVTSAIKVNKFVTKLIEIL